MTRLENAAVADIWSERKNFVPSLFKPSEREIATAPNISSADSFIYWQQQEKRSVPIWNPKGKTTTYRTKKPIAETIYKDNGLFFAENENLSVCGYGETQEKAMLELGLHILHFYRYYRKLNKDDAVGEAVRLKEFYKDLLIKE